MTSLEKSIPFRGIATALITPFREGKIDYAALGRLIEQQLEAGVAALLVAGTTGESATLREEEHADLVRFAKSCIGTTVPLIAGCGSNSTVHAVTLAQNACSAGADALLAVTPYYNKASDQGLLMHFRTLADATPLPLILYNVPSRTGVHLSIELYQALAVHPHIAGVKEASGNLELLEGLCATCGDQLSVYTGNDSQLVAAMKLGALGAISVCSNIFPRQMCRLYQLCQNSDYRQAELLRQALLPKMQALFWEVNPIPVKYVLAAHGACSAEYRLPLCSPAPDTCHRLDLLFDSLE